MYEDEPQDRVHDVLAEAVYGDHPLGRRVLGDAEVIGSIPVPRDRRVPRRALHGARTSSSPPRATWSTRRSWSWPRQHLAPPGGRAERPSERRRADDEPRFGFQREGHRAVPHLLRRARASPAPTSAASRSACSTRSSAARPRRGCSARSARSAAWPTRSAPTRSSTWTRHGRDVRRDPRGQRRARPARSSAASWAACATSGVTDEELERAKEHVKGRMVLSLESSGSADGAPRPLDAVRRAAALARRDARGVEAVTGEDLAALARSSMTRSASRPPASGPSEERFEAPSSSVSEALAAGA